VTTGGVTTTAQVELRSGRDLAPASVALPACFWEEYRSVAAAASAAAFAAAAISQGLTLVHFSAQLERFVWDRGCAEGLCSPC
jgi:hypothetical protein